ncbi:ABC transporter ATP-binding protein [Limoniibacter endophyticus]|uniref:Spermidine/putrescine ABC transporter ATP-binding protein n=1 Tax=Limoniibacter endophyticus TaxID=1565040 RepID=A0A8J3DQL3_9HYPH|nr:ABC transporter ATP-binding protein [Limoniibacter endophyticus]GHC80625.1 spermidine/putrescine ABC transporter ATP-binding protein [Limoniibacter endophyticus]
MSHSVELSNVSMIFGKTTAVDDVSFTVDAGEFFSILGPSGCGKTTLLRMIAGFSHPTSGTIRIGDKDMGRLSPNQRPTAMIFQSLALFPLMPVWENIAFGLEARGASKAERRRRADELLKLIALEGFGDRLPDELSGGQRQRVAIARALAVEPQVLLLDEPLSALDLKLRQHMRTELRALQKRTGVTFIYITHDQSEALAMSDRVAVMSKGVLQQVASPRDLYANPKTHFVAEFVGETNAIDGTVSAVTGGIAQIETNVGFLRARAGNNLVAGSKARLYIRPEALFPAVSENVIPLKAQRIDFEGPFALLNGITEDGMELVSSLGSTMLGKAPAIGDRYQVGFAPEHGVVLAHE